MGALPELTAADRAFYTRYGGVALGLRFLSAAAKRVQGVTTPEWVALSIDNIHSGEISLSKAEHRILGSLDSQHVALKYSGVHESFSQYAIRGANSSTKGPGPFICKLPGAIQIAEQAATSAPVNTCAIVLQSMVISTRSLNDVTVHASANRVVIEARDETDVAIFDQNDHSSWIELRSGATATSALREDLHRLAQIHLELVELLGFAINTEGFLEDDGYVAIQLRPIPSDLPSDTSLTDKVWAMASQSSTFVTHFTYGVYNLRAEVIRNPAAAGSSIGLFESIPYIESRSAIFDTIGLDKVDALRAIGSSKRPIWLSTANIASLAAGRQFVALDASDAFHLSHDIHYLPPAGSLREHFKYAACNPIADSIYDKVDVHVVSDGNFAAIRLIE